jgi:two-component system, OmpR family, sensor histidine kinase QseC
MKLPSAHWLSLERRVFFTVAGAMALVYALVVLIANWEVSARGNGVLDQTMMDFSTTAAKSVNAVADEAAIASSVQTLRTVAQTLFAQTTAASHTPVHLFVASTDGRHRFSSDGIALEHWESALPGLSDREVNGRVFRLYTAREGRWQVVVVDEPGPRRAALLALNVVDTGVYVGGALLLTCLLLAWLVRRSMAPLAALSREVALRSPLSLEPIRAPAPWRELSPLIDAMNAQFERVGRALANERAFIHDAAHELRTPLAAIQAQAHVLAFSPEGDRQQALARLEATVQRTSRMAQQLLALARTESNANGDAAAAVDVVAVLREAICEALPHAQTQRCTLELHSPDAAWQAITPTALCTIADNLIDNALRYAGPGCDIQVYFSIQSERCVLQVSDNGPGIAPQCHEQAFMRFWRGPGTSSHSVQGTGLGLAIVRQAARALGGSAEIVPVDVGCTVCVQWPLRSTTSAASPVKPSLNHKTVKAPVLTPCPPTPVESSSTSPSDLRRSSPRSTSSQQ